MFPCKIYVSFSCLNQYFSCHIKQSCSFSSEIPVGHKAPYILENWYEVAILCSGQMSSELAYWKGVRTFTSLTKMPEQWMKSECFSTA